MLRIKAVDSGEIDSEFGDVKYRIYRDEKYVGEILVPEGQGLAFFMSDLYAQFSSFELREFADLMEKRLWKKSVTG